MRLLWIGTKPADPPVDGGRLVAAATMAALRAIGHEITFLAPGAPGIDVGPGPRQWTRAALTALGSGRPLTIERHAHARLRTAVARALAAGGVDLVHVEQPHAFANAEPALAAGVPVVLRAHNVEHALWQAAADRAGLARPWLRREARRLARFEAAAVAAASATIALTPADREALQRLAPGARVLRVPPPFAPAGARAGRPLPGAPALVWCGSAGWLPNDDAVRWLGQAVWPAIRARLGGAVLHVFGRGPRLAGAGVLRHDVADSREIFDPAAMLLLPIRLAVGVRMRVLEAWSAGMPIVATPAAVSGLSARDGENVLLAVTPGDFAAAVARLDADAALRARVVAGGRATLAAHHAPDRVAAQLTAIYAEARG